jgi:hypothetical protein
MKEVDIPKMTFHIHEGHYCWLWSLIIFLIQRSLLSAMFIPHEVFTPHKYVHSSTRGVQRGGTSSSGSEGSRGKRAPSRGLGEASPEANISL